MKYLTKLSLLLLLSSCTITSPSLNKSRIEGQLFDSETLQPIKKANVNIVITDPKEIISTVTDNEGKFSLNNEGETYLFPEISLDESDLKINNRKVKATFDHEEYISDLYEETSDHNPSEMLKIDVGSFYLQKKETTEFLARP